MKLELGLIRVSSVKFGEATRFAKGTLEVNRSELQRAALDDPRIHQCDIDLAHPGDEVRIIPVKDVIEPRVKVKGNGDIFPGMEGKVTRVGEGRTHVLQGATIVTTGKIVGFQEGIIDMSGPGADYTPFSATHNIVVTADPVEGLSKHQHEQALRLVGFRAARYVAEAARDIVPDEVRTYEWPSLPEAVGRYPGVPKVVYLYMLQSQGLLHDTYVYGIDAKRTLPTLISPTEVMDGAIVSGNCVSACDKNTTFHHLNNPVIEELFESHGRDLNFIGVVISNENVTLADKERSSSYATKLVQFLGADGAVVSEEGFGNPDADLIMNCVRLESLGIKTVLITDEYAGQDGASQSLADSAPEADAVVTAGNANELVTLPPMPKVIGHVAEAQRIAGGFDGSLAPDGSITVEIQAITGATNELGFNKMGARGY